jgi:diguanylate cyclase
MGQEHIQLDLMRASSAPATGTAPLLQLADRLLQLLASGALHSESIDTSGFRRSIERFRQTLPSVAESGSLAELTADCLETCEQFHRKAHAYLDDRESELIELIEMLRTAMATVSRGSLGFEQQIEASTERLAHSARLDDLTELKRAVQEEVESIKQTASERHDMEAAAFRRLTDRVEDLERQLDDAHDDAAADPLTGIPNRDTFERELRRRLPDAQSGHMLVVAVLGLDDFTQLNDTHGRMVGDRVLLCFAQLLTTSLREDDHVARFDGEKFAVVMADVTLDQAKKQLAAARQRLEPSYRYEVEGNPVQVGFTYSCGLARYAAGDSADTLLRRADDALGEAQRQGVDRVVTSGDSFLRGLLRRSLGRTA